jgi:hypothetical protein
VAHTGHGHGQLSSKLESLLQDISASQSSSTTAAASTSTAAASTSTAAASSQAGTPSLQSFLQTMLQQLKSGSAGQSTGLRLNATA